MARKKKKITKAKKRKIAMRNLRKAWKANRKSKSKRRRNPKKGKRKVRRKSKARTRKSKASRKRRSRRNPARIGGILSGRSCMSLPRRGRNPSIADSLTEMGLDYAYAKPSRRNPCSCMECPTHAPLIRRGQLEETMMTAERSRYGTRKNPGWSFKNGQVAAHDEELSSMYHRSARLPRSRRHNPRMEGVLRAGTCRRNPQDVFRAGLCRSPWASV